MSPKTMLLAGVFSVLAIATLPACGPDYDRMEITNVNTPPMGGTVNFQRIEIIEGTIVTARIEPRNDDNESMHCHVRAELPNILEVSAVVNDRVYAFIGQHEGTTKVEFTAGDEVVLIVEAIVKPQPALQATPSTSTGSSGSSGANQ
jgi:hypothetical protein